MKRRSPFPFVLALIIFFAMGFQLTGCRKRVTTTSAPTPGTLCGNAICDTGETSLSCPVDCSPSNTGVSIHTTYITTDGVGDIAVMIATPKSSRYPEGSGVVVISSPIFNTVGGFLTDPDLTTLGLIQVSFLWPGESDSKTGVRSGGLFDFGGDKSSQVLRDVTRFASGLTPDKDGRYLPNLMNITPLTSEVGLYAYADASIPVINVLTQYGEVLPGLRYFIGRENPTVDTLSCLEAGYMDDAGRPVYNPFYKYPGSYSPVSFNLTYTNILWDPNYVDNHTGAKGIAFLDLDGSKTITTGDFVMSWRVPVMNGKRYYSIAVTQALLDNGELALSSWPVDLATPEETARDWPLRQNPYRYADLRTQMPGLKVMLVFAQEDHAQAAKDKPHIHQAFQGFRFDAGLWVRLNPDRAYIQSLIPSSSNDFPDNPANTQPDDWMQIGKYAYPGNDTSNRLVPLAAVAEMADRVHFDRWDENLGQILYIYFPPTEQP